MNQFLKFCNPAVVASLLLSYKINERKDIPSKCEGALSTDLTAPLGLLFLGTGSS